MPNRIQCHSGIIGSWYLEGTEDVNGSISDQKVRYTYKAWVLQLSNYNYFDIQLQNYHYHIADNTLQDVLRKVYRYLLHCLTDTVLLRVCKHVN